MTKILGLSAKKQGGKNTSANFIVGTHMWAVNLVSAFKITDKGKLWINDLEGDRTHTRSVDERTSYVHCENDKLNQKKGRSAPCDVAQTNHYWNEDEAATLSSRLMCICTSRKNYQQFG